MTGDYRSFWGPAVFSLLLHVFLLAFCATLVLPSATRPRASIKVTLWQKPIPLPVGEPAGPPGAAAAKPQPKIVQKPQPPANPQKTLEPPNPPQHPKPELQIARKLPKAKPPSEAIADPKTAGIGLKVEKDNDPSAGNGPAAAGDGNYGEGKVSAGKESRKGSRRGPGRGGGELARPNYATNPKPPYPLMARRMGVEGMVVLRVFVREDGRVGEVAVSQSSGFKLLDQSALKTVRDRWRFLPARLDGEPVESWVEVPIRFVLKQS
jgi:periplasmic protein TonB